MPVLTGTPVQNNLVELWGLLHWLYPSIFTRTSERIFKDAFNLERGMYSLPFLTAAQALLGTIMIRRTKTSVELSVPPRNELTVFLPLTEAQRFWTYRLLTRMDTLDLEQIFAAKVEDTPQHAGRQEVLQHLQAQMEQNPKDSGSGEGNRAFFRAIRSILLTRLILIQSGKN